MSTWVLLRGLMREARHWGNFPQQLAQAVSAEQVVALDFPGNGQLHTHTSLDSVAAMADYAHEQLRQRGVQAPVNVLALSLGGMVAMEWARNHPQDIGRMVLVNTSAAPYNPFYQRLRSANYPALLATLLRNTAARREALVMRLTSNLRAHGADAGNTLQQWIAYADECPITRGNFVRQLRAAARYRAPASLPGVPVLLLGSEQDHLVNVACSRTLAQQWKCPLRLHPLAGHDLPLDDGAWVIEQILSWCLAQETAQV